MHVISTRHNKISYFLYNTRAYLVYYIRSCLVIVFMRTLSTLVIVSFQNVTYFPYNNMEINLLLYFMHRV